MSTLVKRNSLFPSVFSDFFENDKFFNSPWAEREFGLTVPAVNIKESDKDYSIEFAAPGYNKDEFSIKLEGSALTVSAENKEEKSENTDKFTRREFSYSSFSRSFELPRLADAEKIDATYKDGILKLIVLKRQGGNERTKKEIKIG